MVWEGYASRTPPHRRVSERTAQEVLARFVLRQEPALVGPQSSLGVVDGPLIAQLLQAQLLSSVTCREAIGIRIDAFGVEPLHQLSLVHLGETRKLCARLLPNAWIARQRHRIDNVTAQLTA